MANIGERDRGQIVLVAAFALAIVFVSLALIVNSAIFTENLASRGETSGSEGALSMRSMVETNVGTNLEAVNRQNDTSPSALNASINQSIENISLQTNQQQIRSSRIVAVENLASPERTPGQRIVQNDTSAFDSGTGGNYVIAEGIERDPAGNGTRAFRINASSVPVGNDSAFEIMVNQTGATGNDNSYRVNIYDDSPGIHVRTIRNDGASVDVADCEVDQAGPTVEVDVTGGTVEGEPCPALRTRDDGLNFHFGAGTDPSPSYDIYFHNATAITGNFSMIVYDSGSNPSAVPDDPAVSQPFSDTAIYDLWVRYIYVTSDLQYETDIRVAPGEPDV